MKDIFAFVGNLPWWVFILGLVWYIVFCFQRENRKIESMTDSEKAEYFEKIRRKQLGLD